MQETSQGLRALCDHVLDLSHELFLTSLLENNYFNRVSFINYIRTVVSVFKYEFEFIEVTAALQLGVCLFFEEALSERSAYGFRIAIINIKGNHF